MSEYDLSKGSDKDVALASLESLQLKWVSTHKDNNGNRTLQVAYNNNYEANNVKIALMDLGLNNGNYDYEDVKANKPGTIDQPGEVVVFRKGIIKLIEAGVKIPVVEAMMGNDLSKRKDFKSLV